MILCTCRNSYGCQVHGREDYRRKQARMQGEAMEMIPDSTLLAAMRAWTLSPEFSFYGMSENWKMCLRRALAEAKKCEGY